jgi:hypothetical protein
MGGPEVKVYDAATGTLKFDFFAYNPSFTGGVRVAVGDVNGDGIPDIVTAPGPGGGPQINVYDGSTGKLIQSFFAFNPAFNGGSYVAAGDLDRDGFADIVVGADAGGGPQVNVFSGKSDALLQSFFAYSPTFAGGVRVAATTFSLNVGGVPQDVSLIVTGAGPGGGPQVNVFQYLPSAAPVLVTSIMAFAPTFAGGITVATAGDETVVGAGPGGGPEVRVYAPNAADPTNPTPTLIADYFAFAPAFLGGVNVGMMMLNGQQVVLAGAGPGGAPEVRLLQGPMPDVLDDFFAFDPAFSGGVYVA